MLQIECTFPPAAGRCGGASRDELSAALRGVSLRCCIGADICFGALMGTRPFRFVRSDIPLLLSSDILAMAANCYPRADVEHATLLRQLGACEWKDSGAQQH